MQDGHEAEPEGRSLLPWVSGMVAIVLLVGPSFVDLAAATQLIPVQGLYAIQFVVAAVIGLIASLPKLLTKFEKVPPGWRVPVASFGVGVVFVYAALVVVNWPTTVRGVPTAETRGIVAAPSPSLMLPTPKAGIKPTRRSPESTRDLKPPTPTSNPPAGPVKKVESVISSPVQPEPNPDQPVTEPEPEVQSQEVPANEPPRPSAPPQQPTNVRITN